MRQATRFFKWRKAFSHVESRTYHHRLRQKQVLTDVSFDAAEGEIVLLTGGNGSGKSPVLKTI